MAIETQPQLESRADLITDETESKANTGLRIGTLFKNLIQSIYAAVADKVDKVTGKGLSENDYTSDEKSKLEGLNNYDDTVVLQELANKVEQTQIDTAIDGLKGGVAPQGDTLNKLHQLIINIQAVSAAATDIADRDTKKSTLKDQQNIYVTDASGDATVNSGWAIYKFLETPDTFIKVMEQESLDINLSDVIREGFNDIDQMEILSNDVGILIENGAVALFDTNNELGLFIDRDDNFGYWNGNQGEFFLVDNRSGPDQRGVEYSEDITTLGDLSLMHVKDGQRRFIGKTLSEDTTLSLSGNNLIFNGLPNSPSGLPAGALYNDGGTLKIA